MASARFTPRAYLLRAYLLRGDSAAIALDERARQFDAFADGHVATAIVGVGNARTADVRTRLTAASVT